MRFFIFCFVLLTAISPAWAVTFTVEKDGSGDFTIIQDAVDAAAPGDTIIIRDGIYRENVTIRVSGTANLPIVIRNYPGETPVLDGTKEEPIFVEKDRFLTNVNASIPALMDWFETSFQLIVQQNLLG